jgi:integrase
VARTVQNANLQTREARLRLAGGETHWMTIDAGLHLGYRRARDGGQKRGGKWILRWRNGTYRKETFASADDTLDADGAIVLSFFQAQARARERYIVLKRGEAGSPDAPLTVKVACERYVEYLKAEKKTGDDTEQRLAKHVYPLIGSVLIIDLTTAEIEKVKRAMVRRDPDDPEVERRSKDSANRVLSMTKAALNRAFRDPTNGVHSDAAWRRVQPFHNVGQAREVHLDQQQVKRLLNVTRGAFRHLVTAALLTGARPPHELVNLRVRDFHPDHGTLSVTDGKTGARTVTLSREATLFFTERSAGKHPDDLLLPKDDGSSWGKNHHIRPMKDAVAKAKLPKDTTIYSLRHTHISDAIISGMPLTVLAENCGTSVAMIERNYAKAIAATRSRLIETHGYKLGLKPSNVRTLRKGP